MGHVDITELESKIAYLERHVEEQDRVMLQMGTRLDKQEAKIKELLERSQSADKGTSQDAPADEKPPHY